MTTKRSKGLYSFSALAFMLSVVSCGGSKSEGETTETDTTGVDSTIAIVIDPQVEAMLPLFKLSGFPYAADTNLIAKVNSFDSLSAQQVKVLNANFAKHSLNSETDFSGYCVIDSVKRAGKGKYAQWAETVDIGMLKYATVYALHQLKLDNRTSILVWGYKYASYEACPYFSGTTIYMTLLYDGKISETLTVAEDMGAGDPPVSMSRMVTSEFSEDGKLVVKVMEEDTDVDEEEKLVDESVKKTFQMEVKDGKFNQLTEKIDKPIIKIHKGE